MGYPEANPMAITNEPAPGTLNRGRIRGSSNTPIMETTPRPMRISESIKNGSKAGNTISHHILSPLKAEAKASSG